MAATSRALSTSTVEQSIKALPAAITGMMSAATCRSVPPSGSMVITASRPVAAAAALDAMFRESGRTSLTS